jgi:hypothetical protein
LCNKYVKYLTLWSTCSVSQRIPFCAWNWLIHCIFQKIPRTEFSPPAQLTFLYVPFNIIIASTLRSTNFSLAYRFSGENFHVLLLLLMRNTCAFISFFLTYLLWSTDTLLSKDLETNNKYSRCYTTDDYNTAVSEQRLGKQVTTETNTQATIGKRCF